MASSTLQQAITLAEAGLGPQRDEIQQAIAKAEADRLAAAKATEGVIRAVGDLSSGDAAAAQAAWAQAADRLAGMSGGLSGSLREMQGSAAAEAAAQIARLGGVGELQSGANANANVTQFLGTQPVDSLGREAARALVQLQTHRQAGGLALADRLDASDYNARGQIGELRQKLLEIEAKRPGTILEAEMSLRQIANQERATDVQIGSLQLQVAKTASDRAIAMTNLTGQLHVVRNGNVVNTGKAAPGSTAAKAQQAAGTNQQARSTAAKNALLREASDLTKATGYIHKVQGGQVVNTGAKSATQVKIEREQARADAAAAQIRAEKNKPGGGNPPTAKQISDITKSAQSVGKQSVESAKLRIWQNTPNSDAKRPGESDKAYADRIRRTTTEFNRRLALNYGTLMAEVIQAIGPHFRVLDYPSARIRTIAQQILRAAGITPSKKSSPQTGR